MSKQKTLAASVACSGIGVHSGRAINLTIKPAPPNHGIKFVRTDLRDAPCVPALFKMVTDTSLATVLGKDGVIVSTIEHLMAAFAGMGIDNAVIEIDGYELPIMDGSAFPFVEMINQAGVVEQPLQRCFFIIKEPIELAAEDKFVAIYPDSAFRVACTISYDNPLIGEQTCDITISQATFAKEISRARTFGFYHEYQMLKQHGLARGGSLDNTLVIDGETLLNPEGLRYDDEFVRHKILDCIGDFSLLGMPVRGRVVARKSGHLFNHQLLQKIFQNKQCWETGFLNDQADGHETRLKSLAF